MVIFSLDPAVSNCRLPISQIFATHIGRVASSIGTEGRRGLVCLSRIMAVMMDKCLHTTWLVALSAAALLTLWSAESAAREIGPESNLCAEINTLPPGEELVLAPG